MSYTKAKLASSLSSVELVPEWEEDAEFFRELEKRGIKLNEDQIKLVRHKDGTAQANSGAGAGKSGSMVARLSYLDKIHKIDLSNVLLITFTAKAAEEMIAKASKLGMTSKEKLKQVTAGTFHSVFLKVLRDNGENREVYASDKSKQITIKMIFRSLKIDEKKYRPEDILALISHYKNNMIDLEEYKNHEKFEREFYQIWSKYEQYKEGKQLIDFDDMLLNAYHLLNSNELLLESLRNKFQYIMVDEVQDSNKLQFKLVEMVAHPRNNILIIGDSDQCIFSFNGAKLDNIMGFSQRYENTKIIELKVNYRCSAPILGLANHAISKNKMRIPKASTANKDSNIFPTIDSYATTEEEAESIVKYIMEEVEAKRRKYSDFAVLFRSNSNSRAVFEELLMNDIPFTNFSSSDVFYDTSVVKPLLAYLRVTVDPYDFASIGEILPTLFIAKDKIKELGKIQQRKPIANPIEYAVDLVTHSFQQRKINDKLNHIKRVANLKPIVAIKSLREDYEKFLAGEEDSESTTLYREIIKENLDELENSSKKFNTVSEYIKFIDRVIKNAKMQKENKKKTNYDSVKLMTIHKSKGLEFPVIFGIMQNEGILPHKSALEPCTDSIGNGVNELLEEENRLFYVLCTRSEEVLKLSYVENHRGRDALPSRFIEDYI